MAPSPGTVITSKCQGTKSTIYEIVSSLFPQPVSPWSLGCLSSVVTTAHRWRRCWLRSYPCLALKTRRRPGRSGWSLDWAVANAPQRDVWKVGCIGAGAPQHTKLRSSSETTVNFVPSLQRLWPTRHTTLLLTTLSALSCVSPCMLKCVSWRGRIQTSF